MAAIDTRTNRLSEQELADIRNEQAKAAIQAAALIELAKAKLRSAIESGDIGTLKDVVVTLDVVSDKIEEAIV